MIRVKIFLVRSRGALKNRAMKKQWREYGLKYLGG